MGFGRHLPIAIAALAVTLAGLLASGCGSSGDSSSSERSQSTVPKGAGTTPTAPAGASAQSCAGAVAGLEGLRVTGIGCAVGRGVAARWSNAGACSAARGGTSRPSCTVGGYRCLGASTDRGIAISCSRRGRSISFVKRD